MILIIVTVYIMTDKAMFVKCFLQYSFPIEKRTRKGVLFHTQLDGQAVISCWDAAYTGTCTWQF